MFFEVERQNLAGGVTRVASGRYRKVAGTPEGALFTSDLLHEWAREGRIYVATPGAAENTTSTGAAATSFSATTPDLTLEVPSGTTAVPVYLKATQAGTVAGGAISVVIGVQNALERSSGGTVMANIFSSRIDGAGVAHACTPYVAPTVATDTVGVPVYRDILTQSVTSTRPSSTDDVFFNPLAQFSFPLFLVGPAALKFYSWAGTTAPTWYFEIAWAEIPSTDLTT